MSTVKVAGLWELGWCAPITEFDLWAFPLRDLGVDEWIMAPVSGIQKRITEFASIEEAIVRNPELAVVFVDEFGETALADFTHPTDVLYVLGRAGSSPLRSFGSSHKHESVRIETRQSNGLLWPHQAITVVLHDRLSKEAAV